LTIIRPTTINARFSQPVGLGGEKLWLCPTLGGDRLDLSGNGNHGTYYGGMGTVADKYKGSRAYDLDGVDDYIRTDLKGIRNYESRTVAFWSNLASVSGAKYFCNWYDDVGGSDPRSLFFLVYQNKHTAGHKNLNATILVQGGVPSVGWKHYAFTYEKDSTLATIYVNGLAVVSASKANTTWQADFAEIGRVSIPSVTDYTQQRCDDIRFFDRALTPSEIKHLASKRGVLGSPRQPYDPLKRTVVRVPAAIPAATKVGSIKKPTTIIKPSYQAGYARNASESENPKLWDGLVGAWMPSLGVTGRTLRDVVGKSNLESKNTGDHIEFEISNKKTVCNLETYAYAEGGDLSKKFQGGYSISINLWRRITGRRIPFAQWGLAGTGYASWLLEVNTSDQFKFYNYNGGVSSSITAPAMSLQKWQHVTVTWDGSTSGTNAHIYYDGIAVASGTMSVIPQVSTQYPIQYGRANRSTEIWSGKIGQTLAYNRALSPQEIKQLYVDSLAPFRRKQRVSVAVPAAVAPSATYHPLRSLAHPLEQ
jgi:hypothetical protein